MPPDPALWDNPLVHVLWLPSWYPTDREDLAGSFFREQTTALAASGMTVGVLAPYIRTIKGESPVPPYSGQIIDEDGVRILRFGAQGALLSTRRLTTAMATAPLMRAFSAYCDARGRPDFIHAHSLFPGGHLAAILSKKTGIPWGLTEHRSLDHLPIRSSRAHRHEQRILKSATFRSAVSPGHARHLEQRFGRASGPWIVTPNLLSTVPQPESWGPIHPPIIGHLSHLDPGKKVDLLIRAFGTVAEYDPTIRLRIAGPLDTPAGQAVHDQVQESPYRDRIELIGRVEREQVPQFMEDVSVFALPSESETFGVVLVEALAMGTPVVATRTWGAEGIIDTGDGYIVDLNDEEGFASALARIITDPSTPQERQERSSRCIARFGEAAFATRWEKIYTESIR
ncbi:MAG: glycosyltransferase [Actinomycetaceae bacterium]|nr:glycosyltransferase [Actinomycetaceae bacterium]